MKAIIGLVFLTVVFVGSQIGSCGGRNIDSNSSVHANTNQTAKMDTPPKSNKLPVADDIWGGDHVRLTTRANGADIEFDCAHGQISEAFETDAEGRFDLAGTFVREGGPIRGDQPRSGRAARYSGQIKDSTMNLTVRFVDDQSEVGTFSLKRGHEGRLWKCR